MCVSSSLEDRPDIQSSDVVEVSYERRKNREKFSLCSHLPTRPHHHHQHQRNVCTYTTYAISIVSIRIRVRIPHPPSLSLSDSPW